MSTTDSEDIILEEEGFYNFIPFDTLSAKRFPFKDFPKIDGIIIKTLFVPNEETGRRFPQKSYFYYNQENVSLIEHEKVNKRQATKLILENFVNYLITARTRPKRTEFIEKKKTKTGKTKYEIKFTQFDSFHFDFTKEMFETEDVSTFINSLPHDSGDKTPSSDQSTPWKVEYAKSSRATCKKCNNKILKEKLRIGEPSLYDGHISFRWHHLKCVQTLKGKEITGMSDLKQADQSLIDNLINNKEGLGLSPQEIIISIIRQYANSDGLTAVEDISNFAKKKNISKDDVSKILDKLEENGLIYSPSQGKVNYLGD